MKSRTLVFIATLTTLIFTGCQNTDLSSENQNLKQQITELEYQITELEQQLEDINSSAVATNSSNQNISQNTTDVSGNSITYFQAVDNSMTYTLEELSVMVDEFVASVGSATPDINNSSNLDQFFSLKRKGDQIEHSLENYENSLEDQYRAGTLTREDYKKLDREIERLEEHLDAAYDRLEIAFDIDD